MAQELRDIPYGEDPRQRLDVYRRAGEGQSLLVYLYGGSWKSGRKSIYRGLGRRFAKAGITTVIPDYRLFPQVRFPAFLSDGAEILKFVEAHAREWGADPRCIVLAGHSAGAHTAALLAFDGARYAAPPLAGIVAIAGPLSFNPLEHDSVRDVFLGHEPIEEARPIKRVRAGAPPFLLLHGAADKTVGAHNSQNLAQAISSVGGAATLRIYPRIGHIGIIVPALAPLPWLAPTFSDIVQFVRNCPPT